MNCQDNDKSQSTKVITEAQILGLSDRLPQFFAIPGCRSTMGEVSIQKRLLLGSIDVNMRKHPFVIHKKCYDQYNRSKLERAKSKRRKVEDTNYEVERETRRKSKPQSDTVAFGERVCMFCLRPDEFNPRLPKETFKYKLVAAAAYKRSSKHVENFSRNLRCKAEVLQDGRILRLLETDARANELYYHKHCLLGYNRR